MRPNGWQSTPLALRPIPCGPNWWAWRSPESRVWLLGRTGRLVERGRPLFKYFSPAFKARVKSFLENGPGKAEFTGR